MFFGVLMEASRWITQCRLNKIKDTDGNLADVCWREERGVWYHSLQRKEGCGIVQKLNPLGRFNSQSCLVRSRRHFAWKHPQELAKDLVESSSSYVHYIKIYIDLLFPNTLQTFSTRISYFRLSCLTTFRRRWNHLVLDSSCLRRARLSPFVVCLPPESRRNQLESPGYLPLSFVLSLEMCFKFFLGRHFGDPKKNFWILLAVQWNAARLQCSQWPSNGIFESKSFYFKETFSASFVILFKCCKFREQWNLTPVHIWASTL